MNTLVSPPSLTVPGPSPAPILGNALHVLSLAKDSVGYAQQLFQTYGPIVSLSFNGGTNLYSPLDNVPGTVLAYGPEIVRTVANQHEVYYKFPLSGRLYRQRHRSTRTQPLQHFMVGLFGVNSDRHRQARQLLMPAFHKQRLDTYCKDIVAITASYLDQLQEQPCDIAQFMQLLTMEVVTKTLFGTELGNRGSQIGKILVETLRVMGAPLVTLLPFDLPGLPYHHLLNLMAQFEVEMQQLIESKQATASGNDILSMLIAARDAETGKPLSHEELLGHVGVLFAAGHDTSSNALTWTLFLLSQHPKVQADLLDELESVLHGAAPTVEQLPHLTLLERVIKESMRVLPPVPWNARVTSQPTVLSGYALPAGTEVFVSIYQTHHMPELYPDPELFNPQRWEGFEPSMYEYNPFSAGPRKCIGAAFAMMEIKIVLAMLLQRYRLQFLPQRQIDRIGTIVMAPKSGMPMMVHQQDRQFTQGVGGVRGNVREMVKLPD